MKPQIVMTAPSPEAWLYMLLQKARELELPWLDLIVDQAEMGSRWQSRVGALYSPCMLLQSTAHADAADE
ncbi:hypothetical protein, partial [Chromobacterium piscinae]